MCGVARVWWLCDGCVVVVWNKTVILLGQKLGHKVKCGADRKQTARNNRAAHKQKKAGQRHETL